MKKNTLLIACILALGWQVQAQKKNVIAEQEATFTRHRWDAGTDLLWLINKNTLPATTVFVRYNITPKNRLPGAVRLRIGMDLSLSDSIQIVLQPKDKIR